MCTIKPNSMDPATIDEFSKMFKQHAGVEAMDDDRDVFKADCIHHNIADDMDNGAIFRYIATLPQFKAAKEKEIREAIPECTDEIVAFYLEVYRKNMTYTREDLLQDVEANVHEDSGSKGELFSELCIVTL